ncbi:MAG: tetratricopeptide repeat protein, partial [Acidobacteriaceae bacterium]|nr:tetratricopeptide repeat protein [Acidobacteriaceae bacterium]
MLSPFARLVGRRAAGAALMAALVVCACAQTPGDDELTQAYKALAEKDYDSAISLFRSALAKHPGNAAAHKDLAYTLLKTGENAEARDEFEAALRLNSADETAALEFAFLAFETKEPIEARRTFDRLRKRGSAETRRTAEQAFQNIDQPLAAGIARWKQALASSPNPNDVSMFSAHWELAQLAELRDELPLAAEQYEICRKLKPERSELLLILARVWQQLNRVEEAHAALLAASRQTDSRTAEQAMEQLGPRYPYPYEFLNALEIDPRNVPLRRELAFLYLAMNKQPEAVAQLEKVLTIDPNDRLSRDQLDAVRGVPKKAAVVSPQESSPAAVGVNPRAMGMKSYALGYARDAIKYLSRAHQENPDDAEVMLKLGYAYNYAKDDADAIAWFDRARHGNDPQIAAEATKAFHNLNGDTLPQTTVWSLPMWSSRWHDLIGYGQAKRTVPLPWNSFNHWFSLYISTRFMGDIKSSVPQQAITPQYLSESSVIFAGGVSTRTWHHLSGWAEAGEAVKYLPFRHDIGTAIPDYRGGLTFAKGFGQLLGSNTPGMFFETTGDAVYVSRYNKDWLFISQNRAGRTFDFWDGSSAQVLFNANYEHDLKAQYWANTVEMGPGLKVHLPWMRPGVYFSADFLRGVYTNNQGNPRRP